MGIITVITIFILILTFVTLVFKKWKLLFLSLGIILILTLAVFNFPQLWQRSTDLSDEGLDQVKVGSLIKKADMDRIENNSNYLVLKANHEIYVQVEDKKVKELTLAADPTDTSISTNKGISIKSTFAQVVHQYGDSYRRLMAVEMYGRGIEYRDKKNSVMIRFYFDDEKQDSKVRNIEIEKQ